MSKPYAQSHPYPAGQYNQPPSHLQAVIGNVATPVVQTRPLEIPDMLSQCHDLVNCEQKVLCELADRLQVVCCPETPDHGGGGGGGKEPPCLVSGLGQQLFDLKKNVENNIQRIQNILSRLQF